MRVVERGAPAVDMNSQHDALPRASPKLVGWCAEDAALMNETNGDGLLFSHLDQRYTLAGRLIDPVAGCVHWAGSVRHARRKPLEVLALLARAGKEIVRHQHFVDAVWDGNHLVGEHALRDTISELRQLLGDSDRAHPLLRTIPRRGYQLTAMAEPAPVAPDAAVFAPGAALAGHPGWRLERLLGARRPIETWLAQHDTQGPKVIRICRSEAHRRWLKRELTLLRFLKERLGQRQDLLRVLDWQLEDPPYTLSTPYIASGNLGEWAQAQGGLEHVPLAHRLRLLAAVAQALAAVHGAGLLHRHLDHACVLIASDASGEPLVLLGGFDRGDIPDRRLLAEIPLTASGLSMDASADGGSRSDDLRALGTLVLRVLAADLDGAAPALLNAHAIAPEARTLYAETQAEPAEQPSAAGIAQRLRIMAEGAERSSAPAGTAITPAAAAPAPATAPPAPAPAAGKPLLADTLADMPQNPRGASAGGYGGYRILERLGEGGMGLVYLAEQPPPLRRRIALKVLRDELQGTQALARFLAERQTLALMNHPNIAAVYDVGQTPEGRPYFAMEYVPGLALDRHCDQQRLSVRERIGLFLQACAGVMHAHQRGVIHRDLKPGNILVRQQRGQPALVKIIDFGVAKWLQSPLGANLTTTRIGSLIGTPLYCSPEQLDAGPHEVDTRSDIYSMGVVLYELMAGTTPLAEQEMAALSPRQLVARLRDRPTPDPAQRFATLAPEDQAARSACRAMGGEVLAEILRGDLSWVIQRCLAFDPEDRYASIVELERDLQRWLAGHPVEARPVTASYRLRKLLRRQRTLVFSAGLLLLLLLGASVAAVTGFVRASRSMALAEQAAQEAELAAAFQLEQIRRIDPVRMGGVIRTQLQSRMAAAAGAAADARPAPPDINYVDLARYQLNQEYLQPAFEIAQRNYAAHPRLQATLLGALAMSARKLGALDTAERAAQKALDLQIARLGAEAPETLEALAERGLIRVAQSRHSDAAADLRKAHAGLLRRLGARDVRSLRVTQSLVELLVLRIDPDALMFAESLHADTLATFGATDVRTLTAARLLAAAKVNVQRYAEAETLLTATRRIAQRTLEGEHLVLAQIEDGFAGLLHEQGKHFAAVRHLEAAHRGFAAALGERHEQTLLIGGYLAHGWRRIGRLDEAEALARNNLQAWQESYGPEHSEIAGCWQTIALIQYRRGRVREAVEIVEAAIRAGAATEQGNDYSNDWTLRAVLPAMWMDLGEMDKAESLLRELLARSAGATPVWSFGVMSLRAEYAQLLKERGDLIGAEQLLRSAIESSRQRNHGNVSVALGLDMELGDLLRAQGRLEEAGALLEATLAAQQRLDYDRRIRTPQTLAYLADVRLAQAQRKAALDLIQRSLAVARTGTHPADPRWVDWLRRDAAIQLANRRPAAAASSIAAAVRIGRAAALGTNRLAPLRAVCASAQPANDALAQACTGLEAPQPAPVARIR